MAVAQIKTTAVVLDPISSASAPANSLYSDSGNAGVFTNKSQGGTPTAVGAGSASDSFAKLAKNTTGSTIALGTAVSKASDGSIVPADSDAAQGQQVYGITSAAILNNAFGVVYLVGRNVPGILTGLGFTAGQDIYISQTAGFTADPNSFTGNDDTVTLIGIADCADNAISSTATDLVMCRQRLVSP